MAQRAGQFQVKLLDRQGAVGQQPPGQVFFAQLPTHLGIKGFGKQREISCGRSAPPPWRGHRIC
jgi:hypothetical protein